MTGLTWCQSSPTTKNNLVYPNTLLRGW